VNRGTIRIHGNAYSLPDGHTPLHSKCQNFVTKCNNYRTVTMATSGIWPTLLN